MYGYWVYMCVWTRVSDELCARMDLDVMRNHIFQRCDVSFTPPGLLFSTQQKR